MAPPKRTTMLSRVVSKIANPGRPMKAPDGGKVGMTTLGSRAVPQVPAAGDTISAGANRTQTYTYFTAITGTGADIPILYNGDRLWARVKLTLETAGPVVVGEKSQILPVTSGKGRQLPTGREVEYVISKGTKLYIASTTVNRVSVTIEPLAWLEQIFATLNRLAGGAVALATGKRS